MWLWLWWLSAAAGLPRLKADDVFWMAIAASERRDERDGWAKKALEADGLEFEFEVKFEVEVEVEVEALLPATWELLELLILLLLLLRWLLLLLLRLLLLAMWSSSGM